MVAEVDADDKISSLKFDFSLLESLILMLRSKYKFQIVLQVR